MSNETHSLCGMENATKCTNGLILKAWHLSLQDISNADRYIRSLVYFLALCYIFLGVSLISEKFMEAIEMITSQEKKYKIKKSGKTTEIVYLRIWNETVSNLTLMALGSSAPEILLSIIEILGKSFEAGDLGPSTIVGSAAYNLFVITGICVLVVPDGEVRKTKHLIVFGVTSIWSLFAYIWMYIILAKSSPGEVHVWEAVLTFLFFPLTVFTAYIADTKLLFKNYLPQKVFRKTVILDKGISLNENVSTTENQVTEPFESIQSIESASGRDLMKIRLQYIELIKELRIKYPNLSTDELENKAISELFERKEKSRAYYRMQAIRSMTGMPASRKFSLAETDVLQDTNAKSCFKQTVNFAPGHYTVLENSGNVWLTVVRNGPFIEETVIEVDYHTSDGTAKAGEDYKSGTGKIKFERGEYSTKFPISIIDDDVYEEDEYFQVTLSNPRLLKFEHDLSIPITVELGEVNLATVMILDDDYAGNFNFESSTAEIGENIGFFMPKVIRSSGARGTVKLPIKIVSKTAVEDHHFRIFHNELTFENNQTEEAIKIQVTNENEYEKNINFVIELGQPILLKKDVQPIEGYPKLGSDSKIEIFIKEAPELKMIIDKLVQDGKIQIETSTWKEQFHLAMSPPSGEDSNVTQFILHYLSLVWKVLFALVPPADIWNGWLCFFTSIIVVGILTAIIGDLASFFGCTIGLKDSVTAITFVALGTSLPDTFASKVAAINEKTADSSIGNVMGSNAVNVFLGIGISWSIAAIYHAHNNTTFKVKSGSLGFSVTLFTILAVIVICIMLIRRVKQIGGELGGPKLMKYLTGIGFIVIWFFYIVLSSLEAYCHIKGF